jgi:hypothetical protein
LHLNIELLLLSVCFVIVASAQTPNAQQQSGPVLQVSYIAGAPLTAEQVEERIHFTADRTPLTRTVQSKIYRDGAGRIRLEWSIEGPDGASYPIVYLIDPVARFTAILIPGKVAQRTAVTGPEAFRVAFPAIGEELPNVQWHANTEELGKRTIEGIEAVGTRLTRICQDQPSLRASDERWVSKDLGITLLAEASGPNWKHTVSVQKIAHGEPDAALFTIPSDYTIQDSGR